MSTMMTMVEPIEQTQGEEDSGMVVVAEEAPVEGIAEEEEVEDLEVSAEDGILGKTIVACVY